MSWYDGDDETQGWGLEADAVLLDACEGGMPALSAYAREWLEVHTPTLDELLELLADAECEAEKVPGEDAQWNAELAVARLRSQLVPVPAQLVAA